ncbi:MAG TPA: PQQ-binding-like beta-propeller repeat protein [Lacibacter sp.]|nr:PQQ-binding-like beta-propeller repeat protein [Lacibacter sp.]HMO89881.1 PQQ-binding-like beta-propeller repeat protein [Lacibacter sp.]HMP87375.1 PQQ-binding-like beta-propeller repeat protein [Lacibacter sp.]
MKTMFKAFWLITALLSLNACRKQKNESVPDKNKLVILSDYKGMFYGVNAMNGLGLWTYNMGDGDSYQWASPAVTPAKTVVYNYELNKLFCFNTANGALLWSQAVGDNYYASPLIADGLVYAAGNDKVLVLSLGDGSLVRNIAVPNGYMAHSLNFVKNRLVVGTCGGHLFGLDPVTGNELWEYESNASCYHNNPAVANGIIYIFSSGSKLSAVNAVTGAEVWSKMVQNYVNDDAPVVYNNGILYLIGYSGNKVHAFSANNGEWQHSYTLPDDEGVWYNIAPAVANGVLFVFTDANRLVAFNTGTEEIMWQTSYATITGRRAPVETVTHNRVVSVGSVSSVVWANNMLYFVAEEQMLYAADMNGEQVWKRPLNDYTHASPVVLTEKDKVFRPGTAGVVQP